MPSYYKIAKPDGWDFYTGKTINYRDALRNGGLVKHPRPRPKLGLCSSGVLHASLVAEDCFQGGRPPCSLFVVEGTPACKGDPTKEGFTELQVLEELNPSTFFKWRYDEVVTPLNPLAMPLAQPNDDDIVLLRQWASVWDSVWAYIGWLFAPIVPAWEERYPFQALVDLWKRGLVPSYDGRTWRLHSGQKAQIVYEEPTP